MGSHVTHPSAWLTSYIACMWSFWPQMIILLTIQQTFNFYFTNLLGMLLPLCLKHFTHQVCVQDSSSFYTPHLLPNQTEMSHHCMAQIIIFYSSTEPSGTQVERDNPLYESQVHIKKLIHHGASNQQIQLSIHQSHSQCATCPFPSFLIPYLPSSPYPILPHPPILSLLFPPPSPPSSLPLSGTDHRDVPR